MRFNRRHRSIHSRVLQAMLSVLLVPAGSSVSAQIDVRIQTISDDALTGRLISLSAKQGAVLVTDSDKRIRIAAEDLVRIVAAPRSLLARPRGFTVTLGQGDVLHGRFGDGDAESLVIETVDLGRISLPLELVTRIDAARAVESAYRDSVEWLDREASSDEDRILLTNGDVVRGFITNVGADGISIEAALGETLVPRTAIVAARFASSVSSFPELPYQVVSLQSSGRVTVRRIDWSGDVVKGIAPGGSEIMFEAERITDVEMFGGKWEWLSHHTPISYQHTPMLATNKQSAAMGWGYVRDRNVLGKPLRVAGKVYRHGIGVHSRASLTFDLKGEYREFVTAYGIDDKSGPHADVTVSILVDGRSLHDEQHVRRGKLHEAFRFDVTGAKRIELVVDFGDNGDIQDRFNWIEPALIR